ncbi:SNF2 family N-terminal domain-containing protein [Hypomontagnella monticulosa]|nr:SNF2 family N-terminal domain-containing protein [Hypomontagnella monticulosa]
MDSPGPKRKNRQIPEDRGQTEKRARVGDDPRRGGPFVCGDDSELKVTPSFTSPVIAINDDLSIEVEHNNDELLSGDQEICYGMLSNINTRLMWYPMKSECLIAEKLPDGRSFMRLDLDIQQNAGFLQTRDRHSIGVLSNRTFRGLSNLGNELNIRFEPWVSLLEWDDKYKRFDNYNPKSKAIVCLTADVLVFGKIGQAETSAESLAAYELYLQEPYAGTFQCQYINPQSLRVPNMAYPSNLDPIYLGGLAAEESENSENTTSTGNSSNVPALLEDIELFLNQLPAHEYLSQHCPDQRVTTSLLSHQRTAVDFIARRENSICPSKRSLWEYKKSNHGETYYQHIITGAKNQTEADCLGGILADDMGLGKTLTILAAIVHSMHTAQAFALSGSEKTAKSTIVIVPSELLLNTWIKEIDRHIRFGAIRSLKYHGPERRQYDATLQEYDIILTTYGTAMAEFKRKSSAFYDIRWFRLILDEAHIIRNSSSVQFQAVNGIASHVRWCCTGTPIQNSLDDLGSLIRFLRVPIFEDRATFRKHISQSGHNRVSASEEFRNLKLLLGYICLRRSRSILPNLSHGSECYQPEFTPQEREQYRNLELVFKQTIKFAAKGHGSDTAHHRVMEALLRLRMFCNNGVEFTPSESISQADEVLSLFQQSDEALCSYCSSDISSIGKSEDSGAAHMTQCLRLVCSECFPEYRVKYEKSGSGRCPLCQNRHDIEDPRNGPAMPNVTNTQYPSKIIALVEDVQTHYLQDKCVIFSFWKKTLDIIGKALNDKHIKYLRVDGDVTSRRRTNILAEFQSRSAARILLMTFSTGAVGLNGLTVANRIHILEPQWNPAAENQAIGRVLRIDQASKVTIIRYAMKKSIEEMVQSRQLRKMRLAGGGFTSHTIQNECHEKKMHQVRQLEALVL